MNTPDIEEISKKIATELSSKVICNILKNYISSDDLDAKNDKLSKIKGCYLSLIDHIREKAESSREDYEVLIQGEYLFWAAEAEGYMRAYNEMLSDIEAWFTPENLDE